MSAAADATSDGEAKGTGKRKLLLLAGPLLLAGLGGGAYFAGLLDPLLGKKQHAQGGTVEETAKQQQPVFVDLPDLITNLNGGARRGSYVKLRAKLELARAEDVAAVQTAMPRIVDLLQTYLREMRPEELRDSSGTYRLREELMARIGPAVAPVRVLDVLFVELLVQ
jgi:flagellar FliL protein